MKLAFVNISFNWPPEADIAFERLNKLFSTAPVLIQPDPSKHFDAEVDTTDVLSQGYHTTPIPTHNFIHVPFTYVVSHLPSPIMMWGTMR